MNKIRFPSGDQTGGRAEAISGRNCRGVPPFTGTAYMKFGVGVFTP
jgi:hypothetical protein